jgi:hypothetical protein
LDEMAFASAHRAADDHRLSGGHEVARGEVADFGGEVEVEFFEGLDVLEVSLGNPGRLWLASR